jgi:hypothetical protein
LTAAKGLESGSIHVTCLKIVSVADAAKSSLWREVTN